MIKMFLCLHLLSSHNLVVTKRKKNVLPDLIKKTSIDLQMIKVFKQGSSNYIRVAYQ